MYKLKLIFVHINSSNKVQKRKENSKFKLLKSIKPYSVIINHKCLESTVISDN